MGGHGRQETRWRGRKASGRSHAVENAEAATTTIIIIIICSDIL
jgi:hypothetical protein